MTNKEFAKTINSLELTLSEKLYAPFIEVDSGELLTLIEESIKMRKVLSKLENYMDGSRDG